MKRHSYQHGCITKDKRRGLFYLRYRVGGELRSYPLGRCASKSEAKQKAQPIIQGFSSEATEQGTMRQLVDQYKKSDRFPARFSTRQSYTSYLKIHILPKWGKELLNDIQPYEVEEWLKSLTLSQKAKGNLKALLHLLFENAMFFKRFPASRNPMELVEVRGRTKRVREPIILTVEQFHSVLSRIKLEPFRTMALTAMCTGLRFSELTGLKWGDIDWMDSRITVCRGVVQGRADETKTRYSNKPIPIDPALLEVWKAWRAQSEFKGSDDWLFPSLKAGGVVPMSHFKSMEVLKEAGKSVEIPNIGWHTFRHSYRSWLDETGAPAGVQQRLMRHADISTTFNIYGDAIPETLRATHSKVVKMAIVPPDSAASMKSTA